MSNNKGSGRSLFKRRRKLGAYDWFDYLNTAMMLLLCVVMLYPMWHVVCASLSDGVELMKILDAIYESARTGHEALIK